MKSSTWISIGRPLMIPPRISIHCTIVRMKQRWHLVQAEGLVLMYKHKSKKPSNIATFCRRRLVQLRQKSPFPYFAFFPFSRAGFSQAICWAMSRYYCARPCHDWASKLDISIICMHHNLLDAAQAQEHPMYPDWNMFFSILLATWHTMMYKSG